jgi:rubrerythrin
MKEIKMLAGHIREEMNDAETYAKLALKYRDDDRNLSQTFEKLAEQELDHADMLHAQASRLIKERKENGETPPVAMSAVWSWEHENMMDCVARVKVLLAELR